MDDNRDKLIELLADKICDYRESEILVDATHVERWISQFKRRDQEPILVEMNNIFEELYLSKEKVLQVIDTLLSSKKIFGPNVLQGLKNSQFLNIQTKGNSQRELTELVRQAALNKYNVDVLEVKNPDTYIYFDDALFSGVTVHRDLLNWLKTATPGKKLYIVFFAVYNQGYQYWIAKILKGIAKQKNIDIEVKTMAMLDNNRYNIKELACLWPAHVDGCDINSYAEELVGLQEGKKYPPIFRGMIINDDPLFLSPTNRDIVERAFLDVGMRIRASCGNPNDKMRPMGYDHLHNLGFGAMFSTYRNCPNNCPLAIWWGDPNQADGHPFREWYPLLPRKVNEPNFFSYFNNEDDEL